MTVDSSGSDAVGAAAGLALSRVPLRAAWRADEHDCMAGLMPAATLCPAEEARVAALAASLIEGARRGGSVQGALFRQLSLDSPAGLALLSLAEALLRIPDADNADRLIRDQLGRLDARAPREAGTLAWALRLAAALTAGPLVRFGLRHAIHLLGSQFIFAARIESALARARRAHGAALRYSFDMLGEAALTSADAERYFAAYEHAIHAVGQTRARAATAADGVSVKLSALHPRYQYAQHGRVMRELGPRLRRLAQLAQRYRIALSIDAEEAERLELSLDLIESLAADPTLRDWAGLGVAVQAYQKRAPALIAHLAALGSARAHPLGVRLVKGAYWDVEIKLAQLQGLSGYPVYTRKAHTDVAYRACARQLLAAWPQLRPQFATHNARTIAEVLELSRGSEVPLEFQCLFGMGGALYRELASRPQLARPVCVYAPIGNHAALLPYLMRRLLENGASSSFVHRSAHAPIDALCADPLAATVRRHGAAHPRIPAPAQLFAPQRRNSAGMDLEDPATRAALQRALQSSRRALLEVRPLLGGAASDARVASGADRDAAVGPPMPARPIRNPADRGELLGTVYETDEPCVQAALHAAQAGAGEWAQIPIEMRARLLERAADLYEEQATALIALIVREAGRTLASGIGEVREAVDSLRYYAAQIRAQFDPATHVPLGVVLCISPWNFPLAIFTGQIAAALAAGNVVIAKPAEQTAATAAFAVRLLRQAGICDRALQLLPGGGQRVGMRLASDPQVHGVVFTGSTATARAIARTLATRAPVPLIAETGGQNAMIVDSSALPEQVVTDVLRSAFDSAGQRCSSLRILCLQQEIATPLLTMLEGAMRELRMGDPSELNTDVGPLIDEAAHGRIRAHLERLQAYVRCQTAVPETCARGVFVPPTLVQIEHTAQLTAEVFGPVLHVLRFDRRDLDRLLDDINGTGFGLTLGIASRVQSTIDYIIERARVGNVYVNRNMIGAVIGVQPFGGQGLSGTGPKVGGPLYLHAMLERTPGPQLAGDFARRTPTALQALIHWLQQGGGVLRASERERLRLRAQRYAQRSLVGARLQLAGHAGESNELRLRPRGVLRATAHSPASLLEQLAAALATGNTLLADEEPLAAAVRAELPQVLHAALAPLARTAPATCQALLVDDGEASAREAWVRQLCIDTAAQEGPIVPLVIAHPLEGYALERLLVEQTVSVNTAAVGGDAELIDLQDEGEDGSEGVSGATKM